MEDGTKKRRRKKADPVEVKADPVEVKVEVITLDGYTVGNVYKVAARKGLNVRKAPGKFADRVKTLSYGTNVVCKDLKKSGNDTWMQIADGWIAAYLNSERHVK